MGFGKDDFLVSITEASISAALQKSRLNVKCICFVLTLTVVFLHIYTCLHARTRTHVGLLRTPREQNYALVTFKDVEDAQQALYALMAHGHADWVLDFEPLDVSESLFSSIPLSPPPLPLLFATRFQPACSSAQHVATCLVACAWLNMIVRAGKVKLQAFISAVRQPAQSAQGSEAQGQISLGGRKMGDGGEVRGKYRIRRWRNLGGGGDMGAGKLEWRRLRELG